METLSHALISGKIKFLIDREKKVFKSFSAAVEMAYPGSVVDGSCTLFPLAFQAPVFAFGLDDSRNSPEPLWDLMPVEVKESASKGNIFFICDIIDCLSIRHGWSEEKVGSWIATVESAYRKNGLDKIGRPKHVA